MRLFDRISSASSASPSSSAAAIAVSRLLAKSKARAQGIKCVSNAKQLQLAWHLYADDNDDKLVSSEAGGVSLTNRTASLRTIDAAVEGCRASQRR